MMLTIIAGLRKSDSRDGKSLARPLDGLRWTLRALALGLGGVYLWAAIASHSMNADGISYLDMGDAIMRGDWEMAVNAVWSPMYPLIVGTTLTFFNPPMGWEFAAVHLTNFVIYILALLSFEFFWHQVMLIQQQRNRPFPGLPRWALLAIGYLIFIHASLVLIEIWSVTPDLLMSVFLYLAAGILLLDRRDQAGLAHYSLLGLVLGLAYLTKAIMFPVTVLLIALLLLSTRSPAYSILRISAALAVFLIITGPWITLISMDRGRLTVSDAGAFTYAKHVNNIPFHHWQGEPPGQGTPKHPTRLVLNDPPVYEFATPIGGTYPVGYDPVYWYEGLETQFNWQNQAQTFLASSLFYIEVFGFQYGPLLFGMLVLHGLLTTVSGPPLKLISDWHLAILALLVFASYGLFGAIGRYVAPFVVLFWGDVAANLRSSPNEFFVRVGRLTGGLIVAFMSLFLVHFTLQGYGDFSASLGQLEDSETRAPSWPGEVTMALKREGLEPGDHVGVIGYGFDSYWARLGRFRIVAELPAADAEGFWNGDIATQCQVIETFDRIGVEAIVAENVPGYATLPGWIEISDTDYYLYPLFNKVAKGPCSESRPTVP